MRIIEGTIEQKLTDVILDVLFARDNDEASISELRAILTAAAWKGLGNAGEFPGLLEDLGFTLRHVYTKDGKFVRATYVTV